MHRRIAPRFLFSLAGCLALPPALADEPPQQVVNLVTEGNLQSSHAIGCIGMADGDDTLTPADIYPGVAACANEADFQKAVALYAFAAVYGRFDGFRVADRTAGDAPRVIQMATFESLPLATRDRLISEAKSQMSNPVRMASICKSIRTVGKPNYLPAYMIQHGMAAFTGIKGDGLVAGFDAESTWQTTLSEYLHCPAVSKGS